MLFVRRDPCELYCRVRKTAHANLALHQTTSTVPRVGSGMGVWIDQDLCTGDGLCVDHAPDVFVMLQDGIAYVVESGVPQNNPGSSGSVARVPRSREQSVIVAADLCPGECIFIEVGDQEPAESTEWVKNQSIPTLKE